MGFKKMEQVNNKVHDRECVIFVNFPQKEQQKIKGMAAFLGIKDLIFLGNDCYENTIRQILDNEIKKGEAHDVKARAMILSSIDGKKVNELLDGMKRINLKGYYSAVVTVNSIDWTLQHLVYNLVEEREMINKNKTLDH